VRKILRRMALLSTFTKSARARIGAALIFFLMSSHSVDSGIALESFLIAE